MRSKIKIMSLLAVVAMLTSTASVYFWSGDEDFCLSGGGRENTGMCKANEGIPSEADPTVMVTVNFCSFDVTIGAPDTELNCSGNAMGPNPNNQQ
jgi:hypothetical protein